MKLCRFELKDSPGEIRSGIVYSGKIYETDGANPIAVHEAEAIRPLSPVGLPPSVRVFRCMPGLIDADEVPAYFYTNPASLTGGSPIVPKPDFTDELDYEPYIAVIIGSDGANVPVEVADDLILGYTLMNVLVCRDIERIEKRVGVGPGRSYDVAIPIGPVMTTPDELEDTVENNERGRKMNMTVVTRVNGVEKRRGDLADLPFTFAQLISAASESCPLKTGDVLALGPVALPAEPEDFLTAGDEVQVAVERLGTLALRIG